MPQERPDWIKNDRERQKVYRDTLLFGSSREVLAMARALYLHQVEQLARGKKLHASDERFMRDAEKMIFGELAYVLGITQEEVLQRLVRLEKQPKIRTSAVTIVAPTGVAHMMEIRMPSAEVMTAMMAAQRTT